MITKYSTQRVVWAVSFLLFMTSVALLTCSYRREFNAVERRLDAQQREIDRLTDSLEKTVSIMLELAKKGQSK
jgi:hypothetical protein